MRGNFGNRETLKAMTVWVPKAGGKVAKPWKVKEVRTIRTPRPRGLRLPPRVVRKSKRRGDTGMGKTVR
jgi:hypothetical protein